MNQKTRFYRHYKNKPYKFLGIARHSETLEELALYETLYENELGKIWVRPKDMFFENVLVSGQSRPRFQKIDFVFQVSEGLPESHLQQIKDCYRQVFGQELLKLPAKFERYSDFLCICAFDGEKVVGFKIGYRLDKNTFYSWIGGVLPDYRGLGIAGEMMRLQHEWCVQKGFGKVATKTRNRFPEMIRLNVSRGFQIVKAETSEGDVKIFFEKEIGG